MNLLDAVKKCQPFAAKGKDAALRSALGQVAYDRGVCVASDGRIMAVATTPAKDLTNPSVCYVAGTNDELKGFPQWERVVVKDECLVGSVHLNREALMAALEYLAKAWKAFQKNASRAAKSSPNFIPTVKVTTRGLTDVTAILELEDVHASANINGEEMGRCSQVAFNAEYLLKAVKACDGDTVSIHTQDSDRKACVVRGASDDFQVIVMPVAIREEAAEI